MGTKRVTEEIRKALKRQGAESDVEGDVQVTARHKGGDPRGLSRSEGRGQPGGHGRGGKSSRHQ
jgi:hypothetical protein